jgi:hypothetical protein
VRKKFGSDWSRRAAGRSRPKQGSCFFLGCVRPALFLIADGPPFAPPSPKLRSRARRDPVRRARHARRRFVGGVWARGESAGANSNRRTFAPQYFPRARFDPRAAASRFPPGARTRPFAWARPRPRGAHARRRRARRGARGARDLGRRDISSLFLEKARKGGLRPSSRPARPRLARARDAPAARRVRRAAPVATRPAARRAQCRGPAEGAGSPREAVDSLFSLSSPLTSRRPTPAAAATQTNFFLTLFPPSRRRPPPQPSPKHRFFETFSYLPPLTNDQIAKQVDYIVNNGWTPCLVRFFPRPLFLIGADVSVLFRLSAAPFFLLPLALLFQW